MTKEYYNKNAKAFIEDTINADMREQYSFFEKYVPKKGRILDIGFGSGRDSLYFSQKYEVISIDNSEVLVDEASKILRNQVILMDVKDMEFNNEFDGIWACASLLHIPFNDLPDVLNKCFKALKEDGVMYLSFKYGTFEGHRNGRYFTDINEERLNLLLSKTPFKLIETKITDDVRPDRYEKWLNIIVSK